MFCHICEAIFCSFLEFESNKPARLGTETHHSSFESLSDSSEKGCEVCVALLRDMRDDIHSRTSYYTCNGEYQCTVWCERFIGGGRELIFRSYRTAARAHREATTGTTLVRDTSAICDVRFVLIDVMPGNNTQVHSDSQTPAVNHLTSSVHLQDIGNNAGCSTSLDTAMKWLSTCVRNHPRCGAFDTMSWAPSRLLDLGPSTPPLQLRLYLTQESRLSKGERYLTLSHRWSTAKVLKLLRGNIDSLCAGISLSDFPKTFLNAIQITKAFGIRCLWIDSLCIIQDSIDDWRHESMIMGEVYKHALFNIAATGAVDSDSGCFFSRDPSQLQPFRLRNERRDFIVVRDRMWANEVEDAPLNCRGWVLQERLLAARVLHFCEQRLFWECCEMRTCEGFPEVAKPSSLFPYSTDMKSLVPAFQLHEYGDNTDRMEWEYWGKIVMAYSKCFLTNPEDKLLALSGIATEIQRLLGLRYLAGLWEERLPYELLWYVDRRQWSSKRCSSRPNKYVAPSWSWASVDGPVLYPEEIWDVYITLDGKGECASLLEANISHLDENITGQVDGGFLRMLGKVGTLTWVWSAGEPESEAPYSLFIANTSPPPTARINFNHSKQKPVCFWNIEAGKNINELQSWIWLDDLSHDSSPGTAFCLPVYVQSSEQLHSADGLLLRQLPSGEFQRIGKFCIEDDRIDEILDSLIEQVVVIV